MKRFLLTPFVAFFALTAFSQDGPMQDGPALILPDSYGRKISPDGTYIIGQTYEGSTTFYNRLNGDAFFYGGITFGRGNCVADNGWLVGFDMEDPGLGVIMKGKNIVYPETLMEYPMSDIHGITPDARRVCGVVANPGVGVNYFPFYANIDSDGQLGEINLLPYPEEDFFGMLPQYSSATWISKDGKTIVGQVIDYRGFFVYPIVYKQDNEGKWDYTLPSEPLFNPDNMPIPEPFPEMEEMFPDAPYPELSDFFTPEEVAQFEEALIFWEQNMWDDDLNPYNMYDLFPGLEAYLEAVDIYNEAAWTYSQIYEDYLQEIIAIADTSVFFIRNAMALSGDGRWLATSAEWYPSVSATHYLMVPYLFDLETGKITEIGSTRMSLITNQILPDGRVVCSTPGGDIPARTYLYDPPKEEMLSLEDVIMEMNPDLAEWWKKALTTEVAIGQNPNGSYETREMLVTGLASISDDFSVISTGIDGYVFMKDMYMTYIIDTDPAGIESIDDLSTQNDLYRVFNLQGLNVMTTRQISEISNLPRGVYIVNGKKIKI